LEFYACVGYEKEGSNFRWSLDSPGHPHPNFKELYKRPGFTPMGRPYPNLIALVSHAGCGPETGYAISIKALRKEGIRAWYDHLKGKTWFFDGRVRDALWDIRLLYFPLEAKLEKNQLPTFQIPRESTSIKTGGSIMSQNRVRFYQNDDDNGPWCVETTHTGVDDFLQEVSKGLSGIIHGGEEKEDVSIIHEGTKDTEGILSALLPKIFEIGTKLKGYKADVTVEQVTRAGVLPPTMNNMVWPVVGEPMEAVKTNGD